MAKRVISIFNDKCLHQCSRDIEFPISDTNKQIIDDLVDTFNATKNATGLAAPQIGENINAIIVTFDNKKTSILMLNPKIVKARDIEANPRIEMCLSFPQQMFKVLRYKNITVRYNDIEGNVYVLKFRGFDARVLQHEIDHLFGLTIQDKGQLLDEQTTKLLLEKLNEKKND